MGPRDHIYECILENEKNMHFWSYKLNLYSRLRNRCTPMFIKLSIFFQGPQSYCELNYYTSLNILSDYIYYFPQIFQRRLFKGLCLFRTLEYIKNMASICNGMDKLMNEKKNHHYRIVASTNTCYYSENQIFYSLE